MIEIARVFTFGMRNRKDLIDMLRRTNPFYQRLTFADAAAALRSAEKSGLVQWSDGYVVIYHDCGGC